MKKKTLIYLLVVFSIFTSFAQQTLIKGSVKEAISFKPMANVFVTIEETTQTTQTNTLGEFQFTTNIPLGEQVLKISKAGYITKRYPIVVNENQTIDITDMTMEVDASSSDLFTITLSDDQLDQYDQECPAS